MPLLSRLRNIPKYRILRYGNSFNSSQRYLIRASRVGYKPPKRLSHRSFKAFGRTFDRNLEIDIEKNRNYGCLTTGHVNNTRNMSTEQGQTGMDGTQKENDDLSLPFWVFLWSFLAILAGFIYTKLNKQNEVEYEVRSDVHHSVSDEQIARKLVNEISKKDTARKHTFRRQRSYEIIDGEVRIHYDVSMLDESLHKKANIEGILLQSAEVESIPIRSSSLDELELIYPGNLPRIIEEGEEEVLELENQREEEDNVYVNEDKGKENPLNTAKKDKELESKENTSSSDVNIEEFSERKRDDNSTKFETISVDEKIPIFPLSTNDARIITVDYKKDSCSELSDQTKTDLYLNKNADSSDEFSTTSEESVIENLSSAPSTSKNSSHNSNTTSTSVYKLTEVERSEGHNFIVTRREVTKPNSRDENCLETNSGNEETSFSFIQSTNTAQVYTVNSSQREVKHDTFVSQHDIQVSGTNSHSDNNECSTKPDKQVMLNDQHQSVNVNCKQESMIDKHFIGELSSDDVHNCQDILQEPCALTCLEEGSDILVDSSGDVLFKVIGQSIDDAYLEDITESDDNVGRIERNDLSEDDEFALDENENCQTFRDKSEFPKTWKSLPSWETVRSVQHHEIDSDGLDIDYVDDEHSVGKSEDIQRSEQVKNKEFLDLEEIPNNVPPVDSSQNYSNVQKEPDGFPMKNDNELAFDHEIKEAPLLMLENKIGSRQTIFIKGSTERVYSRSDEDMDNFVVETSFDVSSNDMAMQDGEKVAPFEGKQAENIQADLLECEIPDEIVVAQAVEMNDVETQVSKPGYANPISDDAAVFATASLMEENVLLAKIITMEDPDVHLRSSELNLATVRTVTTVDSREENCTTIFTNSESEIKTITIENLHTLPNLTDDMRASEDCLVHSDNIFEPGAETTTLTNNGVQTVTEVTPTTVHSMIKKFEEDKKPHDPLQTENDNIDSKNDVHGAIVDNHHENSEDEIEIESGDPINDNSEENIVRHFEVMVEDQVSKQVAVPAIDNERKTTTISDLNSDTNTDRIISNENPPSSSDAMDFVSDALIPKQTAVSAIVSESEETSVSDLNTDIISESDSIVLIENPLRNDVPWNDKLSPSSDKYTSSHGQPNQLELNYDAETNNDYVDKDLVEEDLEDVVICANQVSDLQATPCDRFDERYGVDEVVEEIHARPADDEVILGNLTEVGPADEGVIYANEVCDSEKIVNTSESNSKQPYLNNGSSVRYSAENGKEKCNTTVVYAGHFNEGTPRPLIESTNPAPTQVIFPNQITDECCEPTTHDPLTIPANTDPISPQINNEDPNVFPNYTPPTSPSTNYESRSFKETSFDGIPSTSSPATVTSESLPEIRENVFRGETDVDSLSDIDEINIDVIPDENNQKSKSVTDLDEALASIGGIHYLSNDDLDKDNMSGGLSKSVPDILDSCREETLRKTVEKPRTEKLQKKALSLSTPEIASKGKPGSKRVTKIKIVHVKFLEMQDGSGSENVEEDSFMYEGDVPISGKMKRRSRNLSPEYTSPVASPPPDLSREVAQERWIAEKTNLKQLEFEFGDLFQNSPSPPPLERSSSSINDSNQDSQTTTDASKDVPKLRDSSMVTSVKDNSSYEPSGQVSSPSNSSKSRMVFPDSSLPDCVQISTEINNQRPSRTEASTINSRFEVQNQRVVSTQSSSSMEKYYKTSDTPLGTQVSRKLKSNKQELNVDVISNTLQTGPTTTSVAESSSINRSSTTTGSKSNSKTSEHQNVIQSSPALTNNTIISQVSRKTNSTSYRYTPGNTHSYSKVPKPVPEQGKYVVKYGMIASTQSTAKQTNTASVTNTISSPSPSNSPRHGMKLSEKFHMSDESDLGQEPSNQTGGAKTRKSRVSSHKTSRQGGRLVTIKCGIINDYECSSDADSEMSYNAPSPRVKAKRYHRSLGHRDTVDSASSSEPDSPRRGRMKDERRSMSEVFGVTDEQYSGDVNSGDVKEDLPSELKSSSRDQKLFSRFGNLEESEETSARNYHQRIETNSSPVNVYQTRHTTFGQRSTDTRVFNPPYASALERNLSPTSFLQEGNLMQSDDQMSPRTLEFNPFEELDDGFQPFERSHSPTSVYSDTSSVFSFNCDFDPMPLPSGKFEPEVYTCENPTCRRQDILLGPEKTSFKSCPACFTYYCSSECRKLHWPAHKQSCYFGRVNTYVKSIIRLCQCREDLSMYLSQLARDGYKKKGRGVVMAIFSSPELAREFITKGHDAFSGRKPTYSSLAELNREGIISKHRVALMQAVRDYEPNEEFVFNIAVVATNNIPIAPAPRYKLNTVLHCIKMPLNEMIVARQPKDYEKVETRLFALPKCSRHEFVNEMEARRHYCRSLSKNLRQYNIKLKEDYPECYRKLCMYVEHNISFEPMTVYGERSGLSYRCVIAPEQSYPLNAEYC